LESVASGPAEDGDATLAELVERYNEIRGTERPGHERTARLLAVAKELHDVVTLVTQFNVVSRLDDPDRGWRLAAYVYAYETRDPALYSPLCRSILKYRATKLDARISNDNRPFGEKEALLALEQVDNNTTELSADQTEMLVQLRESLSPGPERKSILSRILARRHLSAGPGKNARTSRPTKPSRPKKSASSSVKRRPGRKK
jgi:hypothetical protein